MKRREFMALVPAAMVLAACGSDTTGDGGTPPPPPAPPPPPTAPPAGADVVIDMRDIKFVDPQGRENQDASVTITLGETVGWTHNDSVDHTVTSTAEPAGGDEIDSPFMSRGDTFTFTPNVAGTWTYRCEVHPGIMFDATIVVQ